MNVFDFAMQMEKDGENYYRELAASANNKGLEKILTFLADEEVKHFNIFQKMKEGKSQELPATDVLAHVKNIFVEMKEKGDTFLFDAKQVDYYHKAQDLEKKSENFYREKGAETSDAKEKEMLNRIADEEKRHYFVLENIIEFVKRPERWLEDAEWNHLDEY